MKTKIKLPIFFDNEETHQKEILGMETLLEESDVRKILFYNIDAISPLFEGEKEYSKIYSSGNEFLCTLKMSEVEKLIEQ